MSDRKMLLHRAIPNSKQKIIDFLNELKEVHQLKLRQSLFCMEHTGVYGNHLIQVLEKLRTSIVIENGYHVLHSFGLSRGKDDKTDAIRLAAYAECHYPELRMWVPARPVLVKLGHLTSVRERLVSIATQLKVPLKENKPFVLENLSTAAAAHCKKSSVAVNADIKKIEMTMDKLIAVDDHLSQLNKLIMSVPGVGKHTALQVIIRTNEFKTILDPGKFACYAGVVPFKTESGLKSSKGRLSPLANLKMKSLLHICAVRAIRIDPELKAYYQRKTGEGKSKMAVINAIRNKLVLRIFACVNNNRPFLRSTETT
ncbi:MAG: family transposase [Mucilaginibacter sp.]|nr:family transposase [Mucilaginibacter sp.]